MNRREWCLAVAKLVSPSFPAEAQAALIDMLPAMQHLPDVLFTAATVTEVAGAKRRQSVPAWDEIVGALQAYRRTYLPDPTLVRIEPPAEPERRRPTEEELEHVAQVVAEAQSAAARQTLAVSKPEPAYLPPAALHKVRCDWFVELIQRRAMRFEDVPESYRDVVAEALDALTPAR